MEQRKLGYWETICRYAHDKFAATGNVVSVLALQGKIDKTRLIKCFNCLFQRHAILRARLLEVHTEFFFRCDVDFSSIPIQWVNTNDWQSVFAAELGKAFITDQALWRITLIKTNKPLQHYLILTVHHAVLDGRSIAFFWQELLAFYDKLTNQSNLAFAQLPLLPSIEESLQSKLSWDLFITEKNSLDKSKLTNWPFKQFVPIQRRRAQTLMQALPTGWIHDFKQQCKKNYTRVNAALNAILLIAVQQVLNKDLSTTLYTPVDLRPHAKLKLPEPALGCLVTMLETTHHDIQTQTIWSLARSYQNALQTRFEQMGCAPHPFNGEQFDMMQLKVLFDFARSSKSKDFNNGFAVSNLGQVNLKTKTSTLQPKAMYFCTHHPNGDFIIFLHCLTLNEILFLCFAYTTPLVEPAWVEQVVDQFMRLLKQVCHFDKVEFVENASY